MIRVVAAARRPKRAHSESHNRDVYAITGVRSVTGSDRGPGQNVYRTGCGVSIEYLCPGGHIYNTENCT